MLVTVAHPLETLAYRTHPNVLLTGVGASLSVSRLVERLRDMILGSVPPALVINVGVCSALHSEDVGKVIIPRCFIYSNYDNIEYSFYGSFPTLLSSDVVITDVSELARVSASFCDRDAFVQSRICKTFNIPFCSVKVVSDIVSSSSISLWESQAVLLQPLIDSIIERLVSTNLEDCPDDQFAWLYDILSEGDAYEIIHN